MSCSAAARKPFGLPKTYKLRPRLPAASWSDTCVNWPPARRDSLVKLIPALIVSIPEASALHLVYNVRIRVRIRAHPLHNLPLARDRNLVGVRREVEPSLL